MGSDVQSASFKATSVGRCTVEVGDAGFSVYSMTGVARGALRAHTVDYKRTFDLGETSIGNRPISIVLAHRVPPAAHMQGGVEVSMALIFDTAALPFGEHTTLRTMAGHPMPGVSAPTGPVAAYDAGLVLKVRHRTSRRYH